ncbi:MAG: magnesium/cobalt transporter CorA [Proteobacteria bacterium]|nr:magnesium/cobalt transporter CorA [Pseudomonadota bacterium]MBI3499872.1 magnesium/cobalt transporter CorA [Pseudomonadota bacterium]
MDEFMPRYAPPGSAPGTLVSEPGVVGNARIMVTLYGPAGVEEFTTTSIETCVQSRDDARNTWIHVAGSPDAETVRQIGNALGLHALALEDVLNESQRPKVDIYDNQVFAVFTHPIIDDGRVRVRQASLFLLERTVVSFDPCDEALFEPIRRRLRTPARLRQRGVDYLYYALIDVLIDYKFPMLEQLGARIQALEQEMLETPTPKTMRKLHKAKRDLLVLRRALWPERDAIGHLMREDTPLIEDSTLPFLRDCQDHAVQIIDLLETYREMLASMLDIYLSSQSFRLNETMKVLTIISTLFIPLTFITGLYGMNFNREASHWNMPELDSPYGYPTVLGVMLCLAIGMLTVFRRRGWI